MFRFARNWLIRIFQRLAHIFFAQSQGDYVEDRMEANTDALERLWKGWMTQWRPPKKELPNFFRYDYGSKQNSIGIFKLVIAKSIED